MVFTVNDEAKDDGKSVQVVFAYPSLERTNGTGLFGAVTEYAFSHNFQRARES
jgi:hypothetical protein